MGSSAERRAELAALIDAAGVWDGEGVTFRASHAAVVRSVMRLWRREFAVPASLHEAGISPDSFGRSRYAVRASGNRTLQAREELKVVRAARGGSERNAYLRGAFQGAGYVTPPGHGQGHHLEFVHRDEDFVKRVAGISRAPLKTIRRRGRWVAYTKSADGVTTLLSQMGLHDEVLEYEARSILGEAKANANRVTNFDSANAGRTAVAAARQQQALEALDPDELPQALRAMRELRLENPDASLVELARLAGISKSAANHRLRRLLAVGEQQSAKA